MPTFFGRKYMRDKPGMIEQCIGGIILVLLMLLVGTFLVTGGLFADRIAPNIAEQPVTEKIHSQFANINDPSIKPPEKIDIYTDNLYEKIDGKEGIFRSYHVVDLKFGRFLDTQSQQEYDVYIYDMAEPENAFGIYMAERSLSVEPFPIGRDGYRSGTSLFFWKDKYYVNVIGPVDGGDTALAASKKIASAIASTMVDSGQSFWAESILPKENQKPHTFAYVATSALGYAFLNKMYLAEYEVDGVSYQIYIIKADSDKEARDLFNKYTKESEKWGDKILSRQKNPDGEMVVADSMGVFNVAFSKGNYFAAVTECDNRELVEKQASAFYNRLQ